MSGGTHTSAPSARLGALSFEGSDDEPSFVLVPTVPLAPIEALQASTVNHQPERCVPARGLVGLCPACHHRVLEQLGALALGDGKPIAYHLLQALLTGLAQKEARSLI